MSNVFLSVIPFVTFSGLLARLHWLVPNPQTGTSGEAEDGHDSPRLNTNEAESPAKHMRSVAPEVCVRKGQTHNRKLLEPLDSEGKGAESERLET